MSLVRLSSNCFDAVQAALRSLRVGDAQSASQTLRSIRQDAFMLKLKSTRLRNFLEFEERRCQTRVEGLVRQVNSLHSEETMLNNRKKDLAIKKAAQKTAKQEHAKNKQSARRRADEARAKQREAEQKLDEVKSMWCVPVVGQVLVVRELLEDNSTRAKAAYSDVTRHEIDAKRADSEIRRAESKIREVNEKLDDIASRVRHLKVEQDRSHKELGETRSTTAFVMQAVAFWEELIELTNSATLSTTHLQRIVDKAATRNTVRILGSRGTRTIVRSFRDCWMEVAETVYSGHGFVSFTLNNASLHKGFSQRHSLLP
ncbi:predicted protein [Nematostella vectensis]|uniref:Uncharacterized protein n=1 Tax=Nematostella vectensis TaxID=45351 RepID=A7S5T8_NEMVE|nr:predicted protein [Nematostella vectensis]|eukprot:XP_001632994.1 predicted protein [Nematostella vectensis]